MAKIRDFGMGGFMTACAFLGTTNQLFMEKFMGKYRLPSARAHWWNYSHAAAYFITICTKNRETFFGKIRDGQMCLSPLGEIVRSEWLRTPALRPDMNLELGEFVVMPNHFHAIIVIGANDYNRRDAMHRVSNVENADSNVQNADIQNTDVMIQNADAMLQNAADAMLQNAADAMLQNADAMVQNTDAMIQNADVMVQNADAMIQNADVMIQNADVMIQNAADAMLQNAADAMHRVSTMMGGFGPQAKNLASIVRGFKSAVTTVARKSENHAFGWQTRFHDRIIRNEQEYQSIASYIQKNPINHI